MEKKTVITGLTALLLTSAVAYFMASKQKTESIKENSVPAETVAPHDAHHETSNETKLAEISTIPKPSKEPITSGALAKQPPFSDENYENWLNIASTFAAEKELNPEKYKAGVDFLIETLKTGNVDKMLSQAAGALYNLNDPDLTPVYENILNDPESPSNISPEGMMRILTLYIHQAQPESAPFKQIIEKYKKSSNNAVRSVAQRWQELR